MTSTKQKSAEDFDHGVDATAIPACVGEPTREEKIQPRTSHQRWVLLVFCIVCTSLASVVIFGWPALRRQLRDDGSTINEEKFGAMYTIAVWSAQGGRVFSGLARDYFGTRIVVCVCLCCALAGALGIAMADANDAPALGASLFVMSFSSGILVLQSVGELFPATSSAIITSLTGASQMSVLVFVVLGSLPVTRRASFLGYSAVVAVIVVLAWILLPSSAAFIQPADTFPRKSENEDLSDHSGLTIDESDSENEDITYEESRKLKRSRVPTKIEQVFSAEYLLLLLWFSLCYLPGNFYIAAIGFQLDQLGDKDGYYTYLFTFIYAGSALLAPAVGYMSDRFGLGVTQGLATAIVSSSFIIFGASEYLPLQAQVVSFLLYGVGYLLVGGMFYSNIGRRFGYTNFGTLGGLGLLVAATFSLLQYPLFSLALNGAFAAINFSAAAVLLLTMMPYCAWLAVIERRRDSAVSLLIREEKIEGEPEILEEPEIEMIIEC